ncbi:MAG: carboxypeptidase regulatory-like domain-containing protein, partial [Saprospiraceae bacterium]|nr:carboxypeptidase regulatory-like domain-containing protein [Saprospiraceae bacterium]
MVRKLLHTLLLLLVCGLTFAQTSLTGSVTDSETGEPILYGNVKLYKNGVFKLGVQTDYDGNYSAANIDPGKYDVEASYVGYKAQTVTGVIVNAGKANKLDIKITSAAVTIDVVTITEYKIPLIQQDNTSQGGAITSEQIRNLPTRNISALASTVAGLTQADEGSAITVRGARSDGTDYYIDGMRVNSSSIPDSEIDQLQVISGGLDASYGDATGGVISITTKGPSSKFSGGIEGETSQFLTPYGNHLIGANLSGPIIKKKSTGQSILGFRVSGRYTYNKDDDPPATPVYVATDAKIAEIEQNPTRRLGSVSYPSADWLKNVGDDGATGVDVWRMKYRPDEEFSSLDLVGKLDFRPVDNIDFSVGGQYRQSKDKFTPSRWRLLNHYNNPTENRENYRINVRFRHRLGNETVVEGTDASKAKSPIIRNLSYTLQASYEKNTDSRSDKRHGENFWNYGYIGQIGYQWNPIFNRVEDTLGNVSYVHIDNRQDFTGYTGDPNINPILAAYNGTDVANDAFIFNKNGIENSSYSRTWSNLHRNVGAVYDLNSKNETDLITFNGSVNFEIAPKGSKRGVHSIQAGVLWEQRTERSYTLRPYELWYLAGLIVNNHIQGVDSTKILRDTTILDPLAGEVTAHIYDNVISPDSLLADLLFYKKVREVAGVSNSQYFNINTLSPDQMRLDMFSGSELTKQSLSDDSSTPLLYYYGYDYLGNKKSGTSFNDFFTSRGANGLRDFPIAPNQPIYLAGFIQDKFTYKDIIFRLGLRVDRYDANTKVMRDPYSLYPIQTAKEFASNTGQTMPDGIGEDYKVYVDANGSNTVKAYRNGDQWYTAQGTAVNDSRSIYSS